jgi:DNA uptake protein ComE-like DNA-binding protein
MRIVKLAPWAILLTLLPSAVSAQVGTSVTIVDPSTATTAQLAAVPGFTDGLVQELVAARPFLRQAEFDAFLAPKLTPAQRAEAYKAVFVPIDLNDVTDAEILMIPGVGNRMLREFREYAPYRALAQFHREIDKYVDDAELARLEQYVYVKIDLNTASDADILTIPGVGSRMLREFKEYRPYRAMAQFDREIAKYVDAKELARLRRYVEIR